MHGQQTDKYTEMHSQQNVKILYSHHGLLTVHLSIFMLVINQLDAQNFVLQYVCFMPVLDHRVLETCRGTK